MDTNSYSVIGKQFLLLVSFRSLIQGPSDVQDNEKQRSAHKSAGARVGTTRWPTTAVTAEAAGPECSALDAPLSSEQGKANMTLSLFQSQPRRKTDGPLPLCVVDLEAKHSVCSVHIAPDRVVHFMPMPMSMPTSPNLQPRREVRRRLVPHVNGACFARHNSHPAATKFSNSHTLPHEAHPGASHKTA